DFGNPNGPTIEQIAAAIWMGLPDGSIVNALPQFSGLGWSNTEARERLACQLAVNLVDYIDRHSPERVTDFNPDGTSDHYYGHEDRAEQLYISMIAVAQYDDGSITSTHYAIELYNPGPMPVNLDDWALEIPSLPTPLPLPSTTVDAQTSYIIVDDSDPTYGFPTQDYIESSLAFSNGDSIELIWTGSATGRTGDIITDIGFLPVHSGGAALEKYVGYRGRWRIGGTASNLPIWSSTVTWDPIGAAPLARFPSIASDVTAPIQTTVADGPLATIGEFSNVLALGAMEAGGTYYTMPEFWENIRVNDANDITQIAAGRIDLAVPNFANTFSYLTVFHPFSDLVDNDGDGQPDEPTELAVAGRININTAPWFVIKHLPWLGLATVGTDTDNLAQAIVAWRDKIDITHLENGTGPDYSDPLPWPAPPTGRFDETQIVDVDEAPGFRTTAELLQVINISATLDFDIRKYLDGGPLNGPPDFSTDIVDDDFEERDIIFQRISNLVTVRSDVFTAYILVRIGHDGPKKRMIAIFDRSGVYSPADKPRLVALHPVPDPR
ncbi:MAG: hypothetical protein ACYS6I_04935, partial [Planctomycetota bacterium]